MPVFSLGEELVFPHPVLREPDGLMAVGGDLSPLRLLLAYRWGIFPWFHEGQPILWWWLSPRMLLRPQEVHISRSMLKLLRKGTCRVTIDQQFREVMLRCATVSRRGQEGTWITSEMMEAYVTLHEMGWAHSVEVWDETELIGGMYGVALGKMFFGESMFSVRPNASKVALISLAGHLAERGFDWIDCQQDTPHLRSMGARLMDDENFLTELRKNQEFILREGHLPVGLGRKVADQ